MVLRRFFVLEGIDGTGTTTQLEAVSRRLALSGARIHVCAEPTKGPVGRLIREALSGRIALSQAALAYLFAADREEHLRARDGVLDRLDKGEAVLCDRYLFSSLAYQSIQDDPILPFVLNSRFPLPDTVYYFSIDTRTALERIGSRAEREIFESADFMERVRARYDAVMELYRGSGARVVDIDAAMDRDSITAKIVDDVLGRLR